MKTQTPCRDTLATSIRLPRNTAATAVATIALTAMLAPSAYAAVFTFSQVEKPACKAVAGANTAREALELFKRRFGDKMQVLQPLTPDGSPNGMAAIIKVPTEQGLQIYGVEDGTVADCQAMIDKSPPADSLTEFLSSTPRWIEFAKTTDGQQIVYVDKNSMHLNAKKLIRLWVKEDIKTNERTPTGKVYRRKVTGILLECKKQTTALTAVSFYDGKGKPVEQAELDRTKWTFMPVEPDSLHMRLLRTHCGQVF